MEKQPKTYKTELIIAIITGITGIVIAALSNWDKINKPTPPIQQDTSRFVNKSIESQDTIQYFEDYRLFNEAADYAEHMAKQGWDVERLQYSKIVESNKTLVYLASEGEILESGYTYEFLVFCRDPTKEIKVELSATDTAKHIEPFLIRQDITREFSLPNVDVNAILFQIPDEKFVTKFVFLIVSKKT